MPRKRWASPVAACPICVYNTVIIAPTSVKTGWTKLRAWLSKRSEPWVRLSNETVNAVEAWRGSLPGDGYRNVRRVILHTLNLADLMPIAAVWAGQR